MSLHIVSPLLQSQVLSSIAGRPVFLKLDNVQPGGSFKIRGIGLTMQEAVRNGAEQFVGSSGGNAGMAMAVAAKQLSKKLTIFIPRSTKAFMVKRLEAEGAEVIVAGENWDAANEEAVKAGQKENTFLVHPFDQATTWAGHSTLVDEVNDQLGGTAPSAIVTCVGGGGLAMGILQGMKKTLGWENTKLVCVETEGANCLAAARKAGGPVKLPAITSIATSLGALQVVQPLLDFCLENPERLISIEVTDSQAKEGVVKFATDHRLLVEPACGAVLASVYSQLLPPLPGPLVVVVCGGNLVTLDLVQDWAQELESLSKNISYNG